MKKAVVGIAVLGLLCIFLVVWLFSGDVEPVAPLAEPAENASQDEGSGPPPPIPAGPPSADESGGPEFLKCRVVNGMTGDTLSEFESLFLAAPPQTGGVWRGIIGNDATPWKEERTADGEFIIAIEEGEGPFAVAVRAESFEPAFETVPRDDLPEALVVTLMPKVLVSGRVVDAGGSPVPGAKIYHFGGKKRTALAYTGKRGEFQVEGLPEKEVELCARHDDHLPGFAKVRPVRGDNEEIEIQLGLGGRITGTVRKGDKPLEEAKVWLFGGEGDMFSRYVKTDKNGAFEVDGAPPGEVKVHVRVVETDDESAPMTQRIAIVEAGQTTVVDFAFPEVLGAIAGAVTVEDQPVVAGMVSSTSFTSLGQTRISKRIAEDGTYRIEGIPPGQIEMEVEAQASDGTRRFRRLTFMLPEGNDMQQDVQFAAGGTVAGNVTGMAEGKHFVVLAFVREITVKELETLPPKEVDKFLVASSPVSKEGQFELRGLEPGRYTVVAVTLGGHPDKNSSYQDIDARTLSVDIESGKSIAADFDFAS